MQRNEKCEGKEAESTGELHGTRAEPKQRVERSTSELLKALGFTWVRPWKSACYLLLDVMSGA